MSSSAVCEYDKNYTKGNWVKCWCTNIKKNITIMVTIDKYLDVCPKLKKDKNAK